jgi:hypothetical protein
MGWAPELPAALGGYQSADLPNATVKTSPQRKRKINLADWIHFVIAR